VTQRGNRRQQTFFIEEDYLAYRELLVECCARHGVDLWAYCFMPNHVHLIATPQTATGLAVAIGEAHRRYTRRINFRQEWRGHLWQGRFASVVLDGPHLLAAVRYVERNPVRAGLCQNAWDYRWSSAAAHVAGQDDELVKTAPLLGLVPDWREYINTDPTDREVNALRKHERTGRPLGSDSFVKALESLLERPLFRQKPGRKAKSEGI
jgi:putative transposase